MNTRRSPFQFSSTDPLVRQRELEKRFGLQPVNPKMYIDVNNPLSMGTTPKESSSPRLQHRVPIFADGYDQPIHSSSVDSMSSIPEKKPNVRVIPIEIEGADGRSQRHRTYSGPAGKLKDHNYIPPSERKEGFPFKRLNFEDLSKSPKPSVVEPRVYNIPIQVEDANVSRNLEVDAPSRPKKAAPSANGCSLSKSSSKAESSQKDKVQSEKSLNKEMSSKSACETDQPKNNFEISLKRIDDVLTEFKTYETGVKEFNGTSKDKQYRYLDEMLTRCMLRLDDIDTMGNEEIRLARKSAVKKVQASIDLLESKANVESVATAEALHEQSMLGEDSVVSENNSNDVEMKENPGNDDAVVSVADEANSSEVKEMDLYVDDGKDQLKVSSIGGDDTKCDKDSKAESIEVISYLQDKTDDAISVEMAELVKDKITSNKNINVHEMQNVDTSLKGTIKELSKIADKVTDKHVTQGEECSTLQQQDNNVVEIEMPEESVDKTTCSSDCKSVDKNEVSMMLDQKDLTNLTEVKESLEKIAEKTSDVNKQSEIPEVEMVEIEAISSEESDEKIECDNVKDVIQNSDCLKETSTIDPSMPFKDAEMKDIHGTLDDAFENKELSQDIKCDSSQSELDTTTSNMKVKC